MRIRSCDSPNLTTHPPNSLRQSHDAYETPIPLPSCTSSHGWLGTKLNFSIKTLYKYWSQKRNKRSFLCLEECAVFFPDNVGREVIFDRLGKKRGLWGKTQGLPVLAGCTDADLLTSSNLMFLSVKWQCRHLLPRAIRSDHLHPVAWATSQC